MSEPMTPERRAEAAAFLAAQERELAELQGCNDPIECGHEAALEQAHAEVKHLTARLAKVNELHSEFRIYEVCAHLDHDDAADLVELDTGQYVCRSGYQHSVCHECCAPGDAQSETCVDEHDHAECWPCPTRIAARGDAVAPAESSSPSEEQT